MTGFFVNVKNAIASAIATLSATLAGSSGALSIGYMPAGTGAVATTMQAKQREKVSVFDKMTPEEISNIQAGTPTDTSAAFAAAFATSTNVEVPPGTYMASFNMPNYGRLIGAGALLTRIIPPPGATAVVTIDSTVSTTKSWISIENVIITNPNAVANCTGIFFKGTNVTTIMDYSSLRRVEVSYFDIGIKVVGRLIQANWEQVGCIFNRVGMNVNTDPESVAFNLNTFTACIFENNQQEGFRSEAISLANKFIDCSFEYNNKLNVAGVAECYFFNPQQLTLDECYWETTAAVAVNPTVATSNSIGCRITGNSIVTIPTFNNCHIVGAGCSVLIDPQVLQGGSIRNSSLVAVATGFSLAILTTATQGDQQYQFELDASTIAPRQISMFDSSAQQFLGFINQKKGIYYGAPSFIDMMRFSRFVYNTSGALTIPTPTNMVAGCELYISVFGGGSVKVPAALMDTGVDVVVASGTNKTFQVMSYPWVNKFQVLS